MRVVWCGRVRVRGEGGEGEGGVWEGRVRGEGVRG